MKGRAASANRITQPISKTARMRGTMESNGFLQSLLNAIMEDKVTVGKGRGKKAQNTRMAGLKSKSEREAEEALAESEYED
jgi:hypothetical protein